MKPFGKNNRIDDSRLNYKERPREPKKPVTADAKKRMLLLLLNTALAFALYFGCTAMEFTPILFLYPGMGAALLVAYVIYNRGFVYRNIDPANLPDSLSPVEKTALLADAARRMEKSRWMMMLFLPLLITCMVDMLLFAAEELMEAWNIQLSVGSPLSFLYCTVLH